ncbi:MAG: tandem-95 repeat protein, partial [Gammaproteobacteria bacterium]
MRNGVRNTKVQKRLLSSIGLLAVCLTSQAGSITLDVGPADSTNFIDTTSTNKSLDVAVLSTSIADGDAVDFDATQIDPTSVRFGTGLASPDANYLPTAVRDIDSDGDDDLVLTFAIPKTGIVCEDTSASLTGQLYTGSPVSGIDSVTTPDCPNCHDEAVNYRDADGEAFFVAEDTTLQVEESAQTGFTALDSDVVNGTLDLAADGSFSYTPEPNFFGLDNFSYRDSLNNINTVSISVEAVNDLPVANADIFSIAHGTSITRSAPGVMTNDNDIDGDPLTATLVSNVTNGLLNFGNDGYFSYTPNSEFTGYDSFSYRVSDGVATSATVTVDITLPNVLLIMVDDMGQGDAPIYNPGSAIPMPNLTALANAGIRFDNAHAAAAACSPTRYSLLTGNYPYRGRKPGGVWKSFDPNTMIIPGQQTLGHILQSANYRTGFIGKLHNGGAFWNEAGTMYTNDFADIDFTRNFDRGPTQFGFDYSFILPGGIGKGPFFYFENDRLTRYDMVTEQFSHFETMTDARAHMVSVTSGQQFNGG